MFDLPPMVLSGLAVVLGLGLYAFSWWVLRDLPLGLKILARALMVVIVVLPFALLVLHNEGALAPTAGPPDGYSKESNDREKKSAEIPPEEPRAEIAEKPESITEEEFAREPDPPSPPSTTAKPEPQPDSPDDPSAGGEDVAKKDATDDGAGAQPGSEPDTGAPRSLGSEGDGSDAKPNAPGAPRRKAAKKKEDDWDVVPVYFGTDRARQPNEKRLDYSANRARRLELGRAMVTVPRIHQVPNIERPWKVTIPYFNVTVYEEKEDKTKHFTMQDIKSMSEEDLIALVRARLAKAQKFKDHALVFIHGYNTSFDLAVYRTAQVAYDIGYDGAPFMYSWPSGGNVASYTYDLNSAEQSQPFLREFLTMVAQKSGATKISIIAHSMGNQPLLRVLQGFMNTSPPGIKIDQLILAAPDVDRDTFENVATKLQPLANGITLYAAANDRALDASESFHRSPRAGDVPAIGPLVLAGIDTIDVTAVSMDSLGLRHSGYAENNTLLKDIGRLIETGERPPELRVPSLEKVTTDKGIYWRYPASVTP